MKCMPQTPQPKARLPASRVTERRLDCVSTRACSVACRAMVEAKMARHTDSTTSIGS